MLGVVVDCLMLGAPWRVRSGVSGAEGGVDPSVSAGSGDGLTSKGDRKRSVDVQVLYQAQYIVCVRVVLSSVVDLGIPGLLGVATMSVIKRSIEFLVDVLLIVAAI